MASNKQAFPSVDVPCGDRVRTFCMNNEAFCVLEEAMSDETQNEDYNVFTDFEWSDSMRATDLNKVMWAGFYTDAKKDKVKWTIERAKEVIDMVGIAGCHAVLEESLERAMKVKDSFKKKTKAKAKTGSK